MKDILTFLRPTRAKVKFFVVLLFLLPYPIYQYLDYGFSGWGAYPLYGPLFAILGLLSPFGDAFHWVDFVIAIGFLLTAYLLACVVVWFRDRRKRKKISPLSDTFDGKPD